ncbi:hypothetical protein Tco_1037282 [Tanacetum coccineum]
MFIARFEHSCKSRFKGWTYNSFSATNLIDIHKAEAILGLQTLEEVLSVREIGSLKPSLISWKLLGILYNRLNSVSIIVSSASYIVSTGRRIIIVSTVFTQCFNIVALELSKGANSLQAEEQDIPPLTITTMKIPIIRKGEYDIWIMRMRQYICHTDHNLWDVIVNGDLEEEPAPTTGETSAPPAPKTAKQLAARRNQERVKSILLLAIPDEYLLKFHNVADAKSL